MPEKTSVAIVLPVDNRSRAEIHPGKAGTALRRGLRMALMSRFGSSPSEHLRAGLAAKQHLSRNGLRRQIISNRCSPIGPDCVGEVAASVFRVPYSVFRVPCSLSPP